MVAYAYRMPVATAPGEVNRAHPFNIEPCGIDQAIPPTAFGQAVVVDRTSQGVRPVQAGDTAITYVYGFTVRPYPYQAGSAGAYGAANLGGGTPALVQAMDVLRSGYIIVPVVGTPHKGDPVFIWIAVSGGGHVQGGAEAAATAGSTIQLASTKSTFNGMPDSTGLVEIAFNV
jgi:hypothetical protein